MAVPPRTDVADASNLVPAPGVRGEAENEGWGLWTGVIAIGWVFAENWSPVAKGDPPRAESAPDVPIV